MLISSRGRYALLVMIDLAGHRGGLVPGRQIAERLELSQKYLERILRTLAEAGLIEGSHGKGGGYRLLRSPADYTAGEILRAAEGTLACLGEDVQLTPADCYVNYGEYRDAKDGDDVRIILEGEKMSAQKQYIRLLEDAAVNEDKRRRMYCFSRTRPSTRTSTYPVSRRRRTARRSGTSG